MVGRAIIGMLAATVALPAWSQSATTASERGIRDYLIQCHAAHVCNGTYLVARRGRPLFRGAFGDAGDAAKTPLTADHAFDIGSISKQFTAMAVLRLASQGKVALTDPVVTHLPDFPYRDVTIEQLLHHTSGIPDILSYYGTLLRAGGQRAPMTTSDVVTILAQRNAPLRSSPGSKFSYNNTGFMVAALIVEKAAGEPFETYLERNFFKPLGMKGTRVRMPANEALIAPRAMGFRPAADGTRRANEQIPGFYVRGAGGIYSTVSDLMRWENALPTGRVVPLTYWRQAVKPVTLTGGKSYPYGYGISLKPAKNGAQRYTHGGDWRGFKANLSYYPDSAVTVIQLTNNSEDDSADVNDEALATLAAGGTVPPVLPPIGGDLFARLGDGAAARAWFDGERTARPARYEFREDELNTLGYRLIDKKEVGQALLVFQSNVAAFPKSAAALDSLADGQEASGDMAGARETMRKALALDPASKDVREHAARLDAAGKSSDAK